MKENNSVTKSGMVYNLVRKDIISNKLVPGTRLVVGDIAKKYGISMIPVRESFQILVNEGFLNSEPNQGFKVSQMSQHDVKEIFEMRIELEALATRLAVENMTEDDFNILVNLVDESEHLIAQENYEKYWKSNRQWHLKFYSVADNTRLLSAIENLYHYSERYPTYFTEIGQLNKSIREHRFILEACSMKNGKIASEAIRQHTHDNYLHIRETFGKLHE